MNEIIAVIRPGKDRITKEALSRVGCPSVTSLRAHGRGRQRGLRYPAASDAGAPAEAVVMRYLPKKILFLTVPEKKTKAAVHAILNANQTGQFGDGKIFILEMEESYRIRTGERGESAVK